MINAKVLILFFKSKENKIITKVFKEINKIRIEKYEQVMFTLEFSDIVPSSWKPYHLLVVCKDDDRFEPAMMMDFKEAHSGNYSIASLFSKDVREGKFTVENSKLFITNVNFGKKNERTARDLVEKNAMIREIVSYIHHDTRAGINTINGWSDPELYSKEDSNSLAETLEEIHKCSLNLKEELDTVVNCIRFLEENATLDFQIVDLNNLIKEEVLSDLMLSQAKQKRFEIKYEFEKHPVSIKADKILLINAIKNLIKNAIKYGIGQTRQIIIQTQIVHNDVIVSIRDFGPGIPNKINIWKKGVQGSPCDPGLGIGLAMVKKVTELCGGKAYAKNNFDHGATFYMKLPLERGINNV